MEHLDKLLEVTSCLFIKVFLGGGFFSGVADEHIRERERESCFLQKKHEDDREDKQHTEGAEKRRGDPAEATCLA